MKYKSTFDESISFEELRDTPISYLGYLDLVSVLQVSGSLQFFFEGRKQNRKRYSLISYCLIIHNCAPYRLMEEDVAYGTVWKYLVSKKFARGLAKNPSKVYRLWGTPYIKEMNTRGTYSEYKEDVENKVFQIMIITEDETIEIVNPKMEWVKCSPKKIKDIMCNLIKKA